MGRGELALLRELDSLLDDLQEMCALYQDRCCAVSYSVIICAVYSLIHIVVGYMRKCKSNDGMIGKLSGTIDACYDDHVLMDVGGVGYLVFTSNKTLQKLNKGEFYKLFIETHVREDHIHLYGFLTLEEKSYFILLRSVGGIGTRMALSILSVLTPHDVHTAINQNNKNIFTAISGVGPKLAERIILELKDKVVNIAIDSVPSQDKVNTDFVASSEIIKALTNLGFSKFEAQNVVQEIILQDPEISINELIKRALKNRGTNV